MWNDILTLFKSNSLIEQAWKEAVDMFKESHQMIEKSVSSLRKHSDTRIQTEMRTRDRDINEHTMEVRRKVLIYLSSIPANINLNQGLILLNVIIDIERIADHAKNITDLVVYRDRSLNGNRLEKDIRRIEEGLYDIFTKTETCLQSLKDVEKMTASDILQEYHWINKSCKDCIERLTKGQIEETNPGDAASLVLYCVWLGRINAHLRNILTIFVNPFDHIGFKPVDG